MEFLSNKPLLITDTILRDAHQSQAATRMTTEDMLPALEMLDSIGYYSVAGWEVPLARGERAVSTMSTPAMAAMRFTMSPVPVVLWV